MKKILSIFLILSLLFSLSSCVNNTEKKEATEIKKEESASDQVKDNTEVKKEESVESSFSTKIVEVKKFDEIITYKITYKDGKEYMRERLSVKKASPDMKEAKTTKKEYTKKVSHSSKSNTNDKKKLPKTGKQHIEKNISYTSKTIFLKKNIPYKTVTKKNKNLKKGSSKVLNSGKQGLKRIEVKVIYKNGKEVGRKVISSKVIKNPVNKIVAIGTKVEKPKPDKWVNITGWGNSGKYFKTMNQARAWAEKTIWKGTPETNKLFGKSYTIIQTTWKNTRTGEYEERGFIIRFR